MEIIIVQLILPRYHFDGNLKFYSYEKRASAHLTEISLDFAEISARRNEIFPYE